MADGGGRNITRGSSSEELSSEAPRINFSFALLAGPPASLGLDDEDDDEVEAWLGAGGETDGDDDDVLGGSAPDGVLLAPGPSALLEI